MNDNNDFGSNIRDPALIEQYPKDRKEWALGIVAEVAKGKWIDVGGDTGNDTNLELNNSD